MLNVSEQIKTLYHNDNTPAEIILDIGGTEYNARNILGGSVTIAESINSTDALDFSVAEKGAITFTLFNLDQSISTLQGATVTALHRITTGDNTTEDVPLGVYTIVEALNDGDYLFKCTAYDNLNKFDIIIDDWWNELVFPQTIKQLLTGLCTYCGVQNSFPNSFRNSEYVIPSRPTRVEGTKGTEILGYLQEVIAMYVKCDREGIAKFVELQTTDTSNITEWTYSTIVGDYEVADFTVEKIDKVQVRVNENDVGIVVGTGENAYVIQANPLFYTASTETGTPVVQAIYDAVKDITYTPFKAKVKAFPYVEVGDLVKITTYKGITAIAPLLTRSLSSSKLVFDNIDCPGSEEREQVPTINRQLKIVNQRMHEVVNTVEEFSSTITEIEEEVNTYSTRIEQNSQNITLQAQRTGYKNWLYNSNFTDLKNHINYWGVNGTSGSNQMVNDEDFDLASGRALEITKSSTSGTYNFKQRITLNGLNLNGKTIYLLFLSKIIEASYTEDQPLIANVGLIDENDNNEPIFFDRVGGTSETFGQVIKTKLSKAYTTDKYAKYIDVYIPYFYPANTTGKCRINNMCLLILDSNETVPAVGTWSDLANNDIVSQINLSPEGIAIQANKVNFEFGETSKVEMRENDSKTGVLFDGTGTVDFETNGRFYVKNLKNDDTLSNYLNIYNDTTNGSMIDITNYDINNSNKANNIIINSKSSSNTINLENYNKSGVACNRLELTVNSLTHSYYIVNKSGKNPSNSGNVISLISTVGAYPMVGNGNFLTISNYEGGSTQRNANQIKLNAPASGVNSLVLTNYQREQGIENSKIEMNASITYTCQNWHTFGFSGDDRQFVVSGCTHFYINGVDILGRNLSGVTIPRQ